MPIKLRWPWGGRKTSEVQRFLQDRQDSDPTAPGGLSLRPDTTVVRDHRPFPDPDVFEVWYESEVEETFEGKIWKKALEQEAKMQLRVFQGKNPTARPGEPDYEPDPNVIDLSWIDRLQLRLRELGTDLPEDSNEFTGLLEYRPYGLDTEDIPSAAIEDPLEDVETHTEDQWIPDYVGAGLGLDVEDPLNPQWSLRHSNHPLAPFPGEPLKWDSFVYDDGTTFEGLTRQDAPHGLGVMIFGNGTGAGFTFRDIRRGDKYEGEFQAGWAHGLGQFTSEARGEVYIGEFFAGQRHGCGIQVNMAPFFYLVERGIDPVEAHRKTFDSVMRNIEFRTWYRGRPLGDNNEDETFLLKVREDFENPYRHMRNKERHEEMLRKWASLKSPADKALHKMVEILDRELDIPAPDPLQQAAGDDRWYNDVIRPDNFYFEEFLSELAEGVKPYEDPETYELGPDPLNLRLNLGSELQSYLHSEEQEKVGDALYENPSFSIFDKHRTLASYWLSKDQEDDIDEHMGSEIYNRILREHDSIVKNFEVAYLGLLENGGPRDQIQQMEQTLRYYWDVGEARKETADKYLKWAFGDAPRTHQERLDKAVEMRMSRGYFWDLLKIDELKPLNRIRRNPPNTELERRLQQKLDEQIKRQEAELARFGEGDDDHVYVDEIEDDVAADLDMPAEFGGEGGGLAAAELRNRVMRRFAEVGSLTQPLNAGASYTPTRVNPADINPEDYEGETRRFAERYKKIKAEVRARLGDRAADEAVTDWMALYDEHGDGLADVDQVVPVYTSRGDIPMARDSNASVRENVAYGLSDVEDMMAEDGYSTTLLPHERPSDADIALTTSDVEAGYTDPQMYQRVARQVADDMRRWAKADEEDTVDPEEVDRMRANMGLGDPQGDLRFETDYDEMELCDLNEILGTVDEAREVVVKARMFRWKPDGEVSLRFAQDGNGAPVQLMQDPLHYPHHTKWMAPGPLGQVHPLPASPGIREQLRRIAHNYAYIHSLYNFDWDPEPGSVQWKIDQRIQRSQDLRVERLKRMYQRAKDQVEDDKAGPRPVADVAEAMEAAPAPAASAPPHSGSRPSAPFASMTLGMDRASRAVMGAFQREVSRPLARPQLHRVHSTHSAGAVAAGNQKR